MRRVLLLSTFALAGQATAAAAQKPAGIKYADVAGTWNAKTMIGPKDSVVAEYVLHASTTDKGWTITFTNRPALPVRIITMGGDSIVTEVGPYSSVLRAGQMVTTRTTGHYKGDMMTGTFFAKYANGDTLSGKISGMRKK